MASEKIERVLNERNNSAKNELAALFRRICWDRMIRPWDWERNTRQYLANYTDIKNKNSKETSYDRSNLNGQLLGDKMTWRSFKMALQWLNVVKVRLDIHLYFDRGELSSHSVSFRVRRGEAETPEPKPLPPPEEDMPEDNASPTEDFEDDADEDGDD